MTFAISSSLLSIRQAPEVAASGALLYRMPALYLVPTREQLGNDLCKGFLPV